MLSPSLEDYLEEIYRFASQKKVVRTTDIANKLDVSLPSVTKAVKKLSRKGYLNYKKYKHIKLTNKGAKVGKFLVDRNSTLQEFLKVINSDCSKEKEAEAMEHYLSDETVEAITLLVDFFKQNPALRAKFSTFKQNKQKNNSH